MVSIQIMMDKLEIEDYPLKHFSLPFEGKVAYLTLKLPIKPTH